MCGTPNGIRTRVATLRVRPRQWWDYLGAVRMAPSCSTCPPVTAAPRTLPPDWARVGRAASTITLALAGLVTTGYTAHAGLGGYHRSPGAATVVEHEWAGRGAACGTQRVRANAPLGLLGTSP